jgi:DNA-binding transcriptional LysR family regulator
VRSGEVQARLAAGGFLGATLFDGPKNRPTLTAAGKQLQPALSAAFMQVEQAVDAMLERRHATLDVCCLSTFTMRWLIPRLCDFHARQPGIDVRLKATDQNAATPVSRSDVDITVQALPGPEFEHYYFTLEAAIGGLGICIAPWHLVMDDVRAGRLVAPLGFCASGYRYVARRNGVREEASRLFCDWLQAQASAMPEPAQIGQISEPAVRPASAPRSRPRPPARRAK